MVDPPAGGSVDAVNPPRIDLASPLFDEMPQVLIFGGERTRLGEIGQLRRQEIEVEGERRSEVGEPVAAIERACAGATKPVVAVMLGAGDGPLAPGSPIPSFSFPEQAAAVLGRVAAYSRWRRHEGDEGDDDGAAGEGGGERECAGPVHPPRMPGSTRPSMQATTTNCCLGIGLSPSWAPVPAKERLRSRRGFRLDMAASSRGARFGPSERACKSKVRGGL